MRILVAAMGSRGDVQPALALARALRAAGHDPLVNAPPDFAAWAAELGLSFESCGASVEGVIRENADVMGAHPIRLAGVIRDILLQHLPGMTDRTVASARGCDAIVGANQFLARSVAQSLGIPFVGVVYQPTAIRSAYHPPIAAQRQGGPRWVNRVRWSIFDLIAARVFLAPINIERKRLGLDPARSLERCLYEGVPYMLACDPVVAPIPPDWSSRDIVSTGPWFYEDDAPLPDDVVRFIDAGSPPVYVGFGSMPSEDPALATRTIVAGATAGGRRVLLSKGWAALGSGASSSAVKVVEGPMPHAKLFPRLAAVVHHGGAGTTAAALRAGVPQVIVPHVMDQYYYAHRLATLGLSPPGIPVRRLTAERLAAAIEASLAMPPGPRREAAERLRAGDGLRRAVAFVEARATG